MRDVVSPYGERGLVAIAASPEDFVARAADLLARRTEPWLSDVDNFLALTSWDQTWRAISLELSRIAGLSLLVKPAAFGLGGQHV